MENDKTLFLAGERCGRGLVCKANEECSSCGQNDCNTYTCAYPTPTCVVNCIREDLKCVCKPRHHRRIKNGPCVRLSCPQQSCQ